MQANWSDNVSRPFGVRNGVRQGSVLSPCLFNLYIDDILREVSKCGDRARISDIFLGCLAYADDVTLVSPTARGMQRMLDICNEYARHHALVFNNKKSVAITFGKNKGMALNCPELWLNGSILTSKSEIVHLAVVMDRGCGDQAAVERRVRRFYGAVNSVVSKTQRIRRSGCQDETLTVALYEESHRVTEQISWFDVLACVQA